MNTKTIARQRIHLQKLINSTFTRPAEAIAHMGAMQAQDYYGVLWSLAQRMTDHATEAELEQAFNEGRYIRTHIMRPTWHLVAPEDLRWIMKLTAHRVHATAAYMYRQHELDEGLLAQCCDIFVEALQGGNYLTRNELSDKLANAGIEATGSRLAHIVVYAELELVVCSGPRRGKQFTYALVDERAPEGHVYDTDEALAQLLLRYLRGHAPATVYDFSWWSGLTVTDARTAVEVLGSQLEAFDIDGDIYFCLEAPTADDPVSEAILLPTFDEYLVGYKDFGKSLSAGRTIPKNLVADSPILIDGQLVASWRRTLKRNEVLVDVAPFTSFTPAEHDAVTVAVKNYGKFLGLPVTYTLKDG